MNRLAPLPVDVLVATKGGTVTPTIVSGPVTPYTTQATGTISIQDYADMILSRTSIYGVEPNTGIVTPANRVAFASMGPSWALVAAGQLTNKLAISKTKIGPETQAYLKNIINSLSVEEGKDLTLLNTLATKGDPIAEKFFWLSRLFQRNTTATLYPAAAWDLDMSQFFVNSSVANYLGTDGTSRQFYWSSLALAEILSNYPWPEPRNIVLWAWGDTITANAIREKILLIPQLTQTDILDWITIEFMNSWDVIMSKVEDNLKDAEKRAKRRALTGSIFIAAFTVAVTAVTLAASSAASTTAAGAAKGSVEATTAAATAGTISKIGTAAKFVGGLATKDVRARASEGMEKLSAAMAADNPRFSQQLHETAYRLDPEGYIAAQAAGAAPAPTPIPGTQAQPGTTPAITVFTPGSRGIWPWVAVGGVVLVAGATAAALMLKKPRK